MRVFRSVSSTVPQSPERTVFGIHPTTNKLLVPIDLFILVNGNANPNFDLDVLDTEVLDVNTSKPVGKIKNFSVPPVGNIDPILELNTDGIDLLPYFPNDIKKIILPTTTIRTGNLVTLNGNISFQGNILPPTIAGQSLINTFPFYSINSGRHFSAFRIKFNQDLQLEHIGSSIIMADGSILGMLVSLDNEDTSIAFVYPSSSLQP